MMSLTTYECVVFLFFHKLHTVFENGVDLASIVFGLAAGKRIAEGERHPKHAML